MKKANKNVKKCPAAQPRIQLTEERIGECLREFRARVEEARRRPGWNELAATLTALADAGEVMCELARKSGEVIYRCSLPEDQRPAYALLVTHPYPNIFLQLFLERKMFLRIDPIFGLTFDPEAKFQPMPPPPRVLWGIGSDELEIWRIKGQRAQAEEMLIELLRLSPERDSAGWPDIRFQGKSIGVVVGDIGAPFFLNSLEDFAKDIMVSAAAPEEEGATVLLAGWIERHVFVARHNKVDPARGGGCEVPRSELQPLSKLVAIARWYQPWTLYD